MRVWVINDTELLNEFCCSSKQMGPKVSESYISLTCFGKRHMEITWRRYSMPLCLEYISIWKAVEKAPDVQKGWWRVQINKLILLPFFSNVNMAAHDPWLSLNTYISLLPLTQHFPAPYKELVIAYLEHDLQSFQVFVWWLLEKNINHTFFKNF